MRLIDADELAVTYCEIDNQYHSEPWILDDILAFLNDAPTIEAAPVVHGRWEDKPTGRYGQQQSWCSACRKPSGIGGIDKNRHRAYCPNCGARMDGDGKAPTTNHRVCKHCNTAVIGMEEYAECTECGHPFEEVST